MYGVWVNSLNNLIFLTQFHMELNLFNFSNQYSGYLTTTHFKASFMTHLAIFRLPSTVLMGEGKGTPLQYSCLENPMERGAW